MNRFLVSLTLIVISLSLLLTSSTALAAENSREGAVVAPPLKPVTVYFEGQRINFPAEPLIKDNVLLVPMRSIFSMIGADIVWNNKKKEVTAMKGDRMINLRVNSRTAYISGNAVQLETSPYMAAGTMFVPLRFASEALGLKVLWDDANFTASLYAERPIVPLIPSYETMLDQDANESVVSVRLNRLQENAKTHVVTAYSNKVALLSEENPYKSYPDNQTIELSNYQRNSWKALIGFDVSKISNKHVKAAYLRMVNAKSLEVNAVRTIQVREVKRPWSDKASWQATGIPGSNWEMPGAQGSADTGEPGPSQTTFRTIGWEPAWFIDVTSYVRGWAQGAANNGIMLTTDKGISLFNSKMADYKPVLIVEYSDQANAAPLSYKSKLRLAFDFLAYKYNRGPWSDTTIGIVNAQINADRLGMGEKYLKALKSYFNDYVNNDGSLKNTGDSKDSYYQGALGKALIYMHKRTGEAKYRRAVDHIRRSFNSLPMVDGIYTYQETYQSELVYLGMDFLAAYGQTYGDKASVDLAMDQTIKTFDVLHAADTNGVPFTLMTKTYSVTGTPKGVGWGRGVGWLYEGMAKMLAYPDVKQHPLYGAFRDRFDRLSRTVRQYQDASGLWHNLIQFPTTPLETTGTEMLALGMEYGYREGAIDKSYKQDVNQAIHALQRYTRTGVDMGNAFPANQDLLYSYPYLATTRNSFGFWLELLTTRELYDRKLPVY